MTPPPTSIDGTDITGATIDGQEVQEITVDGQTVFTAGPDIPENVVAQSSLKAWYPFENGAQDETAGDSSYGDSTDFSGSVDGATQLSSGGATDILTQSENSNAFTFDGSNDLIRVSNAPAFQVQPGTFCCWLNPDSLSSDYRVMAAERFLIANDKTSDNVAIQLFDGNWNAASANIPTGTLSHVAGTCSNSELKFYVNGTIQQTLSIGGMQKASTVTFGIGGSPQSGGEKFYDGIVDDVRIYTKELSASEIQQIFDNTKP
jgi:hypothetical protein